MVMMSKRMGNNRTANRTILSERELLAVYVQKTVGKNDVNASRSKIDLHANVLGKWYEHLAVIRRSSSRGIERDYQ
jgi:hypothetical protein